MKAKYLVQMLTVILTFLIFLSLPVHAHHTPEEEVEGLPEGGPITPVNWRHYNCNPDFEPAELPNGIIIISPDIASVI